MNSLKSFRRREWMVRMACDYTVYIYSFVRVSIHAPSDSGRGTSPPKRSFTMAGHADGSACTSCPTRRTSQSTAGLCQHLYRQKLIDGDELGEMLELADGALAFAVAAMLDISSDE